jgi:glycosyltransferase involved in cell wall biosynthesis
MIKRLRIAQVAPPLERVPPRAYGGTERVVHGLVRQLHGRGHDVTTYASADSLVPGRLVATIAEPLRPAGYGGDSSGFFLNVVSRVLDDARDFDLIHSHLEWFSGILARVSPVPVVATFHGRLDLPWASTTLAERRLRPVAISEDQARVHPDVPWTIVHNGLELDGAPFERRQGDDFCFVGRVDPEKGILEAIEIARRTGRRIRIAAKVGTAPDERAYHDEVFLPALESAGSLVEFLGEINAGDRDRLFAESYATLMPGAWPEPFGLVAIESLACGTPLLARRIGAMPEILREGIDGFFGDDLTQLEFQAPRLANLDRLEIRRSALERFSAARMADDYEALYARVLGIVSEEAAAGPGPGEATLSTLAGGRGSRLTELRLPDAGSRIVRPSVRPTSPARVKSRLPTSADDTATRT